jgi:DNA-directed RNA polymerase subunit F
VDEATLLAFHRETQSKRLPLDLSIWNPLKVIRMSKGNATEKKLTLPEVKKLLESMGEENLDQLQRRAFDYVSKFSKANAEAAQKLVTILVTEYGLEEDEAVQIVNSMPKSVDELRVFLAGGRKIIDTAMLKTIVSLLDEHRKLK